MFPMHVTYPPTQVYTLVPSLQPRMSALVKPCVDYLLSLKMPSGNYPGSLESAGTDKLVHWCHGASGVIHMLAHAYTVLGIEGLRLTYAVFEKPIFNVMSHIQNHTCSSKFLLLYSETMLHQLWGVQVWVSLYCSMYGVVYIYKEYP